jgi:hypothetical protein
MAIQHIRVIEVMEEFLGELFYVAQALEVDIKGIGATLEEARANFVTNLRAIQAKAPGTQDPFGQLPPAERRFWDIYKDFVEKGGQVESKYW